MRILFAGGGTAGHISPALAIADAVKEKYSDAKLLFVGREGGDENKAVMNEEYELKTLKVEGFKRSLTPKNVKVLMHLLRSVKKARSILKEFKPQVIVATGGYVSLPVLLAGFTLKIPTVLHESNAYPGLVTRRLGKRCTRVILGVEAAKRHLKYEKNVTVIGNPVRAKFTATDKQEARLKLGIKKNETLIVSFGGSGGAERINEVICEVMEEYSTRNNSVKHVHGAGKRNYQKLKYAYPDLCRGKNGAKIIPYIDNMPELLSAADISITRSGAMTLAELSCVDCIPILIPSPNVAANHQYYNAKAMEEKKGAVVIEEENLRTQTLISILKEQCEKVKNKKTVNQRGGFENQHACRKEILKELENCISRPF